MELWIWWHFGLPRDSDVWGVDQRVALDAAAALWIDSAGFGCDSAGF